MSDILIKCMEMPKQCWNSIEYCPFHFKDYHGKSHCGQSDDIRCLRTKRPKDCPLIEVEKAPTLDDAKSAYLQGHNLYIQKEKQDGHTD